LHTSSPSAKQDLRYTEKLVQRSKLHIAGGHAQQKHSFTEAKNKKSTDMFGTDIVGKL